MQVSTVMRFYNKFKVVQGKYSGYLLIPVFLPHTDTEYIKQFYLKVLPQLNEPCIFVPIYGQDKHAWLLMTQLAVKDAASDSNKLLSKV